MSISLYTGTPGSYKSYAAVCEALSWLSLGRNVITNFPLDWSKKLRKIKGDYQYWSNSDITPNNLLAYAEDHHRRSFKAQTLVVIDEASILFNSRDFARKDRIDWINFFANHRHFNFEFILISQNDKMLDKQIRGLVEYDIKHRALSNYNLLTLLLSKLCGGVYLTVSYWYPCKAKNGVSVHKFSKRKAKCYDTMALFFDKPNVRDKQSKKSKVVIVGVGNNDIEIVSSPDQQSQDTNTTCLAGNLNYDNNTGVVVYGNSPSDNC